MEFDDIVVKIPIEVIYFKLKIKEKFSFSRFGDGEFHYMLGTDLIKNRKPRPEVRPQHHKWMERPADKLKVILSKKLYYYTGLQRLAYKRFSDFINEKTNEGILNWLNGNVIHFESLENGLWRLFSILSKRKCVIVGPEYLNKLKPHFNFELITIPITNCFLEYGRVRYAIETKIDEYGKDLVVLYCASFMSNILIDRFAGQCTQIDIGSAFDPYCGIKSRAYHKNMNVTRDFDRSSQVVKIIKDNMVEDYETAISLGGGYLGLEKEVLDLKKTKVYEWANDCISYYIRAKVDHEKHDLTDRTKTFKADIICLFDTLEHLQKMDALNLLERCEGQIIIFMPVQPEYRQPVRDLLIKQETQKINNQQMTQHLSLWTRGDLEELGFKVWYSSNYHGPNHNNWDAMIAIRNNS